SPLPNDDGFMPVSTWRGYIMVSTDLLPESVTETRRIYPDPQSEPDPSPEEEQVRGLARTDTMMPPPLPRQRASLDKFHQPLRPSPPPSWLWPDGSWLSDFAIDIPASPSFPTDSQFWAMPPSPYLPQHGFLPPQAHETTHPWASLPPQSHGYRRDAGAVGSSMAF
ncbi:hypothetical protein CP532_3090, partial [Ophiocordyceps camponoti-leonardi (nom. inval.)]